MGSWGQNARPGPPHTIVFAEARKPVPRLETRARQIHQRVGRSMIVLLGRNRPAETTLGTPANALYRSNEPSSASAVKPRGK